jgi:hypothetical protein
MSASPDCEEFLTERLAAAAKPTVSFSLRFDFMMDSTVLKT